MRRRIAGNLVWMLAERGLQVAAGIAIVAMLARALGTDGFAHFQYAQSLVYIGASVALICGSEVLVPRLVAAPTPEAKPRLIAQVFRLRFAAACGGFLLVCGFLLATRQPPEIGLPALLLAIPILLREPFGVVVAWMQAHTHNRPNVLINLSALALKTTAIAILMAAGFRSATAFAGIFTLETVLIATLLAAYYRLRVPAGPIGPVKADTAMKRQLIRDGALFWIGFMLMTTSRRIDQLILKSKVSLHEFGAYAASMQILDNYVVLATILVSGIAPLYVYAHRDTPTALRHVLKLTAAMTLLGLAGAAAISLLAPWIVTLLYGSAFAATIGILRWNVLASSLIFADVGLSVVAVYLRKPGWLAVKWGLVLAMTVIVDFLAIPRLGARGAILGYAMANALAVAFGAAMLLRFANTPAPAQ